ncbi:MAG: hypothetical protein ACTSPG_00660, partial [Candidatus Hodarchaeales archaeon]
TWELLLLSGFRIKRFSLLTPLFEKRKKFPVQSVPSVFFHIQPIIFSPTYIDINGVYMTQLTFRRRLRVLIDKGARLRQYFLRGHSNWFALVFSLINFTLIFYNLLFKNLFFIPEVLKSYMVFFVLFGASYFPLAALFGYLDYKKGTYRAEQLLSKELSPIWRELFEKLGKIETENEMILEELKKLIKNQN